MKIRKNQVNLFLHLGNTSKHSVFKGFITFFVKESDRRSKFKTQYIIEMEIASQTTHSSSEPLSDLIQKIETKSAVIGVVGLGYVGLPLAVEYATLGFQTIGIDLNKEKILRLNAGQNYIQDVGDEDLRTAVEKGLLVGEDDFARGAEADIYYICVPTPVTSHKDPDTKYIESVAEELAATIRPGQLFILKSTTYPNTTEGLVLPILEAEASKKGLKLGIDFFLAFSPERIDPGNQTFTTANTPVVVGGVTPACLEAADRALKEIVVQTHRVSSPKVAEMEKLLENTFRSVNIALVNELAQLCDRMGGVSMWEVVEAAATKPFGFMPFFPGPGLGGHCIPVDPYYLSWMARHYDFETNFITLSARVNDQMPFYVADAVIQEIAEQPVRMGDAKVLILGVAFKRDVDDVRHSPALKIIEILRNKGVENLSFHDTFAESVKVSTSKGELDMKSIDLTKEALQEHHVVVIITDHQSVNYGLVAEHARAIVDTRNAMAKLPHSKDKVRLIGGGN